MLLPTRRPPTHSHSLNHSITHLFTHPPSLPLLHALSPTLSFSLSLTHSLTHSLTFAHSLTCLCPPILSRIHFQGVRQQQRVKDEAARQAAWRAFKERLFAAAAR